MLSLRMKNYKVGESTAIDRTIATHCVTGAAGWQTRFLFALGIDISSYGALSPVGISRFFYPIRLYSDLHFTMLLSTAPVGVQVPMKE